MIRRSAAFLALALLVALAARVDAQATTAAGSPAGRARFDQGAINVTTEVRIDQKLDSVLPLDVTLRDELGNLVPLKKYFHGKPVLMVMPFYQCKGTCMAMLNGIVDLLHDPTLKFAVGRDFEVVTISINPKETAALASAKKKEMLSQLGVPGAEAGWHFLTGDEAQVRRVADAAGYRYIYDMKQDQYAHPSGIWLATPSGHISRYFFGFVYPAKDLRLALTEAGQGKIGSVADHFLALCYDYDPARNRYGLAIFRMLQVGGFATMLILGSFMVVSFRREGREARSGRVLAGATERNEGMTNG